MDSYKGDLPAGAAATDNDDSDDEESLFHDVASADYHLLAYNGLRGISALKMLLYTSTTPDNSKTSHYYLYPNDTDMT